jgi:hypothetical protein
MSSRLFTEDDVSVCDARAIMLLATVYAAISGASFHTTCTLVYETEQLLILNSIWSTTTHQKMKQGKKMSLMMQHYESL